MAKYPQPVGTGIINKQRYQLYAIDPQVAADDTRSQSLKTYPVAGGGPAAAQVAGSLSDPRFSTTSLNFSLDGIMRDPSIARQQARQQSNNMRRDPQVEGPLKKRKLGVMGLNWSIVPEDEDDEGQQAAADQIEQIIRGFDYEELMESALEAVWYGPGPAELIVEYDERDRLFRVVGSRGIHGDSIVFDWYGRPYIRVGPGFRMEDGSTVQAWESRARALTPAELEVFFLHRFNPQPPEFWTPSQNALIFHGNGLRDDIYYPWMLKHTIHKNWTAFLERLATGILVIMHADNDEGKKAAAQAVADYQEGNFITMPVAADSTEIKKFGIEVVEFPANASSQFFQYITDFAGKQIKTIIEGQELTSDTAPTGLGSGVADVHRNTFQLYVRFDAKRLGRTMTEELVWPLQRWNNIVPNARLRWEYAIDDTEVTDKMDAVVKAHGMGVTFPEREVRELTGLSEPTDDEPIIGGPMQQTFAFDDPFPIGGQQPMNGGNGTNGSSISNRISDILNQ